MPLSCQEKWKRHFDHFKLYDMSKMAAKSKLMIFAAKIINAKLKMRF